MSAPADLAFRFDSRLDPLVFEAFLPGGTLRPLVEYAFSDYPVDLHFRRDWVSGSQHATLHVGLNRLLDLEFRQGVVRLHPLRALRREFGFDEAWLGWRPVGEVWDEALELFLDQAVPWAAESRGAMGAMAPSRFHPGTRTRWCIAQDFAPQFRDDALRKRVFAGLKADIEEAFDPSPIEAFPHPMKVEAVVLYVDEAGDLLIGDVHPRRASEVPWSTGIALVNARMLRLWLEHDPDAVAALAATVRTRVALGLLPPETPLPGASPTVVPIVQVQSGMSARLRANAVAVAERLAERGVDDVHEVRVIEWSLSGRETVRSPLG
ncbi:hypothetical protein N1031_05350 [Herbiconiux moechotypicola]|uniref:Uncharacterized protein n=1 Tax=Herbiconiux moechotypicola TaxID=637393 RepID=A0ABP5QA76_9MICO|nr:hypothetical protein [Herbiconiux moechotypicola]MCS5729181.1 hypothetical protein [Herbiconiux moechotypicola]